MTATTPRGWTVTIEPAVTVEAFNVITFAGQIIGGWSDAENARCTRSREEAFADVDLQLDRLWAEMKRQREPKQLTLVA